MKGFFTGFEGGMNKFWSNIIVIISSVLLSLVYLVIGIISIFAKLFRKHFLDMKLSNSSYWSDLNLKKKPIKEYYKQV